MTAGIAANSPMAVANSASEIPGATTASDEFCCWPIWKKLFMIPQTVPNRPTNGATAPVVARKLSRSASESASSATCPSIASATRARVPSRSATRPPGADDCLSSASPAAATRAEGPSLRRLPSSWVSGCCAVRKSRSNALLSRATLPIRSEKLTMIAQVQTLARIRHTMTTCTTMSASRNSRRGLRRLGEVAVASWSAARRSIVMRGAGLPSKLHFHQSCKGRAPGVGLAARASVGPDEADPQMGLGEQVGRSPGPLVQAARGGAHFLGAAFDDHRVVEPGRRGVADRQVGHRVSALARFLRRALVDPEQAQEVGARALEPLEVVRMVDHAREVGVLVVHAHREIVRQSVEAAARREEIDGHRSRLSRSATRLTT